MTAQTVVESTANGFAPGYVHEAQIEAGAIALYRNQQIHKHGVARVTPWRFVPNFLKAEFRRDARAVLEGAL